ncbi:unnamed protein product [Brachionus calyciflorus]|uniref:HMG box domain-containing protein n=1 Tax=Brachionus calyciflorus TaxID=104777 RepID=A0A813TN57_9BILA|nr:unnamed protein product [Brachionus calyciflorus]
MFLISNLFKKALTLAPKIEIPSKELTGGLFKELITKARQRGSQIPKNYDEIFNEQFIQNYYSIVKKSRTNAYKIFSSENYIKGSKPREEVQRIAKIWNSMHEKQKQPYEKRVNKIKEEQNKELKKLLSTLKNDELKYFKDKIRDLNQKRIKLLQKCLFKKKKIELKRPKQSPSAFILYVNHLIKTKNIDMISANIEASKTWKTLEESEQKVNKFTLFIKYIDEAKRLYDDYRLKLNEWENKMIFEGKLEMIPKERGRKIKLALGVETHEKKSKKKKETTKSKSTVSN